MRKLMPIAGILALLLTLAACSPAALFELAGSYDYTLIVTDSTHASFPEGYEESGRVSVTTDGDTVEASFGDIVVTGTRNGNSAELDGDVGGTLYAFDLTWTSDTEFTGTGRVDYTNGEYVEFDITGEEAVSVTGAGAQGSGGLLGR